MATFDKFYSGIAKSKYDLQGFNDLVNIDVHSEIGSATCQYALAVESTTPNEYCIQASNTNGDLYFFSTTSGKTWKRTAAGVYSLVNTNANGAHLGARYFNGKIYYATATKLGHFNLASTWTDTFATFTNGAGSKPMEEMNLSLFIGDGKYLAAVDAAGTFSANALDLPSNFIITALAPSGTDLLIGTFVGANISYCKVFLWDTYSASWTVEDEVYEIGINCFINADNTTFCQAGSSGQFYYWSGQRMIKFKKLRGVTTSFDSYVSTVANGKPLIAIGTKIYSLHRVDNDLPNVLAAEYTANATISSIFSEGGNLFVSTGTGISKIDVNYATATLTTPEVGEDISSVVVNYDSLPAGCSIGIETNKDNEGWVTQTPIVNALKKQVFFDGRLGNCNFMQAKITLNPSTTTAPIIKAIEIK